MVSNTRQYGAAIAVTSGLYSLWTVTTAARMVTSGWIMAVVGVVVIVHGGLLLTEFADRFGGASGPLMVGYALVMLLNQALLGAGVMDDGSGMGMDGGMGASPATAGMAWDAGMVALAVLMFASGLIMTRDRTAGSESDGMSATHD